MSPPHSHDPTVSAASSTSELVLPPTRWSVELVVRVNSENVSLPTAAESHRHRSARIPGQASQGSSRARSVIMPGLHRISTPPPQLFRQSVQSALGTRAPTKALSIAIGPSNLLCNKPIDERREMDGPAAKHRGEAVECRHAEALGTAASTEPESAAFEAGRFRRLHRYLPREGHPARAPGSRQVAPRSRRRARAISRSSSAPS